MGLAEAGMKGKALRGGAFEGEGSGFEETAHGRAQGRRHRRFVLLIAVIFLQWTELEE